MHACLQVMKKDEISEEEALLLERALEQMPLKPLYKEKMLGRIIEHYRRQLQDEEDPMDQQGGEYLLRLDKEKLSRGERAEVCETLIRQNYFSEAFQMARQFGPEGIQTKRLLKLCTKMILQQLFDEDPLLLNLSWQVFEAGQGDGVILDYLCEHYNGDSDTMYRILVQAVKEHVETYDLEERLLAQLLFISSDRHLDKVFDLYASRKKTGENIVRAYFTVKSVGYFLKDMATDDKVFSYLEGAVRSGSDLRKTPEIYLLALSRNYSGLTSLSEEQTGLCRRMVNLLMESGMLFSWFKKLSRYMELPGDVTDKEIIEYHGRPNVHPTLKVRILPDEGGFHEEELRMVYKGIYIRQKLLFEGETLEYQIYEEEDGREKLMAEGSIACTEVPAGDKGNRFSLLNSMSLSLTAKEDVTLKEEMKKYVTDNLSVEKLFPLM